MLHRTKKAAQHKNKDKWIGVGGRQKAQGKDQNCLLREVKEETGLTLTCSSSNRLMRAIHE